eukprot:5106357-Prymnesium_polylepis.1
MTDLSMTEQTHADPRGPARTRADPRGPAQTSADPRGPPRTSADLRGDLRGPPRTWRTFTLVDFVTPPHYGLRLRARQHLCGPSRPGCAEKETKCILCHCVIVGRTIGCGVSLSYFLHTGLRLDVQ